MILDSVWLRPCDVRWQWLNPHSPLGVAFSAQNERKRCSCTVRSSLNWSPWRFSAGNRLGIPNFQWFWKFRNSRKIWKFGKISKFKQDLEILWYFRWCCVPCIDTRGKYMILESKFGRYAAAYFSPRKNFCTKMHFWIIWIYSPPYQILIKFVKVLYEQKSFSTQYLTCQDWITPSQNNRTPSWQMEEFGHILKRRQMPQQWRIVQFFHSLSHSLLDIVSQSPLIVS